MKQNTAPIAAPLEHAAVAHLPVLDHEMLRVAAQQLSRAVGDDRPLESQSPEDLIERLFETLAKATTAVFDAPTTAVRFGRAAQQAVVECAYAERHMLASLICTIVKEPPTTSSSVALTFDQAMALCGDERL